MEIHTRTAEPSPFEAEITVGILKRHKSPGIEQIPAELVQAEGRTLDLEVNTLINSDRNKEELPQQRKQPIIALI
jgi:hypothetical protein